LSGGRSSVGIKLIIYIHLVPRLIIINAAIFPILRSLACWDCGFESHRGHGCLSLVSVVCCQVEVSATSWSLVQRSPTECGVSESVIVKPRQMRRPRPPRGCRAIEKKYFHCPSQWPRGLRRGSAVARLLGLWFRISPGAWMSVSYECCVLSGRGLCDGLIPRPEECYRVWCV
jgi:hypothetical protein